MSEITDEYPWQASQEYLVTDEMGKLALCCYTQLRCVDGDCRRCVMPIVVALEVIGGKRARDD